MRTVFNYNSKELLQLSEWITLGDSLLQCGCDAPAAAIEYYDRAIQYGKQNKMPASFDWAHLMGWAWMNRGSAFMQQDSAESVQQAIHSLKRAEHCFLRLFGSAKHEYLVDIGALYANLGQAHFRLGSPEALSAVSAYYDQANTILKRLPWESNARYRYHLTALWLNRGNLYWADHPMISREEAVRCFRLAIEYGSGLSRTDLSHARVLASVWTQFANVLKDSMEADDHHQAIVYYIQAVTVLKSHALDAPEVHLELASVYANLANLRADQVKDAAGFNQVIEGAEQAIGYVRSRERTALSAAQISVQARRGICQAYGHRLHQVGDEEQSKLYLKATDVVDEGLSLIRYWEAQEPGELSSLACRFFRLGEQLYRIRQPRFLAEFILENLDPSQTEGALHRVPEMLVIGEASLSRALADADAGHFFIADNVNTQETLHICESYRKALKRLLSLMDSSNSEAESGSNAVA